jgi:hypothetical protein
MVDQSIGRGLLKPVCLFAARGPVAPRIIQYGYKRFRIKRGPGKGRVYHKLLNGLLIVDSFSDIHFEPKGNS